MADGQDFDAAIYVKNVPEFRFEEGLFHVCHVTGRTRFEFVMRPSIFLKALRAAQRVADEFHDGRSDVVGIKDGRGHGH